MFHPRLLLLLPLLLLAGPAEAKRPKPTPCAPGTFAPSVADSATLSAALGIDADRIVVTSGAITIGSCTGRARTKATKKATRITARLGTCGTARKVTLLATLASPACDTAQVTVRGKKLKRLRFLAPRAVESETTTTTIVTTTLPPGGARPRRRR